MLAYRTCFESPATPGVSFSFVGWTAGKNAIQASEFSLVRWTRFAPDQWTGAHANARKRLISGWSDRDRRSEGSPVNDRKKSLI